MEDKDLSLTDVEKKQFQRLMAERNRLVELLQQLSASINDAVSVALDRRQLDSKDWSVSADGTRFVQTQVVKNAG